MKSLTPNNSGKKFLVEECRKIQLKDFLRGYKEEFKKNLIVSRLEVGGLKVELTTSKTHYGGTRFWFKCPLCERRVGVIFKHPLSIDVGCHKCLNLDYRTRQYKGMIEGKRL